jgi:hypothetical protein
MDQVICAKKIIILKVLIMEKIILNRMKYKHGSLTTTDETHKIVSI